MSHSTVNAEIRAYWRRGAGAQQETRVHMGLPFRDGERVAVEWWATMIDDGAEVTLSGCLLLRFATDGRCQGLREYWEREGGPPRTVSRLGHVAAGTGSARGPVTLCDRGQFQTSSGEEQREQASCREARHPA